jgi:hypothetical protein
MPMPISSSNVRRALQEIDLRTDDNRHSDSPLGSFHNHRHSMGGLKMQELKKATQWLDDNLGPLVRVGDVGGGEKRKRGGDRGINGDDRPNSKTPRTPIAQRMRQRENSTLAISMTMAPVGPDTMTATLPKSDSAGSFGKLADDALADLKKDREHHRGDGNVCTIATADTGSGGGDRVDMTESKTRRGTRGGRGRERTVTAGSLKVKGNVKAKRPYRPDPRRESRQLLGVHHVSMRASVRDEKRDNREGEVV